jgi:hypothetical protein
MEELVRTLMPLIIILVLIFALIIWNILDNPRSKKAE